VNDAIIKHDTMANGSLPAPSASYDTHKPSKFNRLGWRYSTLLQ